jgi:hypothetical protein
VLVRLTVPVRARLDLFECSLVCSWWYILEGLVNKYHSIRVACCSGGIGSGIYSLIVRSNLPQVILTQSLGWY